MKISKSNKYVIYLELQRIDSVNKYIQPKCFESKTMYNVAGDNLITI